MKQYINENQEAAVRTLYGTTDWFEIEKGVRQGCLLSPCLFNLYPEHIMRNAGLAELQAGIKTGGRNINNLRYVDDTTLMAETKQELKSLWMRVKESERAGLKLNIRKTKIIASSSIAAEAAKSLQSCLTLCDPIDGSSTGSPIPGILQARTLEWVAISFSSAWKWKVKVKLLSCVWLLAPHGLQPTRLLHPWDFPGKSTGVGCHCLLWLHYSMVIRRGKVEVVTYFLFLCSFFTVDGACSHEIRKWLLLGGKAVTNLDSLLKSKDITLTTKVHVIKAMVSPVVTYGPDSWTVKKTEHQTTDAFKLWCWRRLLKVPWTARRSNQSILREINWILIGRGDAEAPIFWSSDEKSRLTGKVSDAGKDWVQMLNRAWEDEMTGWHNRCNGCELGQTSGDGERDKKAWHAAIYGVAKSWTQLGYWTFISIIGL